MIAIRQPTFEDNFQFDLSRYEHALLFYAAVSFGVIGFIFCHYSTDYSFWEGILAPNKIDAQIKNCKIFIFFVAASSSLITQIIIAILSKRRIFFKSWNYSSSRIVPESNSIGSFFLQGIYPIFVFWALIVLDFATGEWDNWWYKNNIILDLSIFLIITTNVSTTFINTCCKRPDSIMTPSKSKYLKQLNEIMLEMYTQLREKGSVMENRDDYINGFIDAGITAKLVESNDVQTVIDNANMEVFGITISERLKVYENIELSYDEYIDVPAFFRKGKFTL